MLKKTSRRSHWEKERVQLCIGEVEVEFWCTTFVLVAWWNRFKKEQKQEYVGDVGLKFGGRRLYFVAIWIRFEGRTRYYVGFVRVSPTSLYRDRKVTEGDRADWPNPKEESPSHVILFLFYLLYSPSLSSPYRLLSLELNADLFASPPCPLRLIFLTLHGCLSLRPSIRKQVVLCLIHTSIWGSSLTL